METGCYSLHRLKHRAVIAFIIVFSLLFYILCIHIYYYNRTLGVIGILKNVDQQLQQKVLYDLFTGSIDIEDGKYVLMKNGYQFSGRYFIFFDSFIIGISIVYLTIMVLLFRIYSSFVKVKINRIEKELDYLKTETEHFLFGTKIVRDNDYKECNYLLDRLEQRVHDMSLTNRGELDRMINFHQNIIHQINTPLNTIKILVEYLCDEGKIEKEYLDNINYAINKASDLTHIYLKISKFDSGKVKYSFERIELFEMIEEIYLALKIYADYHQVVLTNKCDDSFIYADAIWIKEAIENIVKNCIEKVGKRREIIIKSKTINEFTEIIIDDGQNYNNIENINFERFESSQSGIGIGLHLCKQIIETHLGDILVTVSSTGGLRFVLKIPNKPQKMKIKLEEEHENNIRDKGHSKKI